MKHYASCLRCGSRVKAENNVFDCEKCLFAWEAYANGRISYWAPGMLGWTDTPPGTLLVVRAKARR